MNFVDSGIPYRTRINHIAYARETSHFMGVSAWLKSITTSGD